MRLLALTLLVLLSLGAGCSAGISSGNPTPAPADTTDAVGPFADEADYRQQREGAIEALEAAAVSTASEASMCRVVAVGERACGGPESFVVYSASAAREAEVQRLADRVAALDRQANAQFGYVSTCELRAPPATALQDGACVAVR